MKYGEKAIICPQCNTLVAIYDGRSTINRSVKCRKCKKLIAYNPETEETEIKPIPERTQGSGMRFY